MTRTPLSIATGLAVCAAGAVSLGAGTVAGATDPSFVTCPFRLITDLPCPLCGMTHSLFAVGDGDLGTALSLAPAIPLVLAIALLLLIAGPVALWRRRALSWPAWLSFAVVGAVLGIWLLRLAGALPGL